VSTDVVSRCFPFPTRTKQTRTTRDQILVDTQTRARGYTTHLRGKPIILGQDFSEWDLRDDPILIQVLEDGCGW
jgi:hypothetical protein